jgi:hypothetical protein
MSLRMYNFLGNRSGSGLFKYFQASRASHHFSRSESIKFGRAELSQTVAGCLPTVLGCRYQYLVVFEI